MSQKEILTRAKQGDPTAINFLINQALNSIGIKAKTKIQNNNLHILLEAAELPDREICIKVIHRGMKELKVPSIDFVDIYGRRLGDKIPEWTEVIELSQQTTYHSEEVGEISREKENTNYSQESSTMIVNDLSKKATLSNPEIIQKKSKKEVDGSVISLNKSARKKSKFATTKKLFSPEQIYRRFSYKQYKFIGLLGTAITIVLVPIYALVVNSQPRKLNNIFSNTSQLPKISQPNTSVAEVSQSVTATIPTPKTIQNSQIKPTDFSGTVNKVNLSEVSEVILSSIKSPVNSDNLITIKAVGDIIPGTNYPQNKLHPRKQELFASVKPLLQDADIVFGNFESTLTSYPNSRKSMGSGKVFAFRTPPDYRDLLKDAGFNVLSVANNHSFDFFKQGFEDTITNIESVEMQAVGKKGEIIYRQVKGVNIGFIAFSNYDYHNSMLDLDSAKKLVQEADKNADIIVISVHAGAEGSGALRVRNKTEYFFGENRGNKVLFAHELIDEGADLVLGHGPHVPRAMEVYQGKLIAYSLGNFMGYRTLSTQGNLGYSLVLELDINYKGDFVSGKILPVHLNSKGIPYDDKKLGRSIKLIRELTKKDFPNTMLEIDGEGRLKNPR
ncbi:CapA family protein [Okeania sp.]|uniref:CapA family protein n=1 Tax=Okeania sp. TaxID=3100323 RepID=UPI002B4ADDF1|nr:CapA family protein [Okeania sp.]MEB3341282.1 CapA family protein [Okeania sp.]